VSCQMYVDPRCSDLTSQLLPLLISHPGDLPTRRESSLTARTDREECTVSVGSLGIPFKRNIDIFPRIAASRHVNQLGAAPARRQKGRKFFH